MLSIEDDRKEELLVNETEKTIFGRGKSLEVALPELGTFSSSSIHWQVARQDNYVAKEREGKAMALDTNRIRAWLEAEQTALQQAYLDQIAFSPEMVRSESLEKGHSNIEENRKVTTQLQQIKSTRTCLLAFLADIDEAIKYIDDLRAHSHNAPCDGPHAKKRQAALPETLRDAWYEAGWDPEDLSDDDILVGRD